MWLRFDRRSGGTGSVLSSTWLGHDAALGTGHEHKIAGNVFTAHEGPYINARAVVFYFPTTPTTPDTFAAARQAIAGRADALAAALLFRPPVSKELARGAAVMPNIHDNFGDLVAADPDGNPDRVILANCTLASIEVEDPDGIHGAQLALTFRKVHAAATP